MATASIRPRRRPVRAVDQVHRPVAKSSFTASLLRAAGTRTARTALVLIGTAGLAALAVAIVGPKRLEREVIRPLRGAIEPQAEKLWGAIEPQADKLWADSRPLRDQIAGLFKNATPTGRQKLVRSFQSWIGHFHAT
jgi:hypothetical protein